MNKISTSVEMNWYFLTLILYGSLKEQEKYKSQFLSDFSLCSTDLDFEKDECTHSETTLPCSILFYYLLEEWENVLEFPSILIFACIKRTKDLPFIESFIKVQTRKLK